MKERLRVWLETADPRDIARTALLFAVLAFVLAVGAHCRLDGL
jgi:hypothetical protein